MTTGAVKMVPLGEEDLQIEGMEEGKVFRYKGETATGGLNFLTVALRPIGSQRLYDFTYWANDAKYSISEKEALQIASSFRSIKPNQFVRQ